MIKKLITILMTLFILSSVSYAFNVDDIKNNILNTHNKIMEEVINSTDKSDFKGNLYYNDNAREEYIAKNTDTLKLMLENPLYKKKDIVVYNNVTHVFNDLGGVSRKDLSNDTIVDIDYKKVIVKNYNKTEDKFDVVMYVGTHGELYNIYHSEEYESYEDVLKYGNYLFSVESEDGFIKYQTDKFSTQIASFLPTYTLSGNQVLTLNYNNFATDFDSVNVDICSENFATCYDNIQVGEQYLVSADSYSDSNIEVNLVYNGVDDIDLIISAKNKDSTYRFANRIFESGQASNLDIFENFDVITQSSSSAPQQIASIAPIELEDEEKEGRLLNNFFTSFDSVTVTFPSNSATRVLELNDPSSNQVQGFNGDVIVDLKYYSSSNSFLLEVEGTNDAYDEVFNVEVCNSAGCTSANIPVTVSSVVTNNPPTQLASISDQSISGTQTKTINFNNIFDNYDSIEVNFNGELSSVSLTNSFGASDVHDDNLINVELYSFGSSIYLDITGKDTSFSQAFTVIATNNDGNIQDTFNVVVSQQSSVDNNIIASQLDQDNRDDTSTSKLFGQTFSSDDDFILNNIKLKLIRVGTPSGDFTVSLREVNQIDGLPIGNDICSDTISNNLISTSIVEYTFSFSDCTSFNANTIYALIGKTSGGRIDMGMYLAGGYDNGNEINSLDGGTSWSVLNRDLYFIIEGSSPQEEPQVLTQLASFNTPINLEGTSSVQYSINDFFENYDTLEVSYSDNTLSQSVLLSTSLSGTVSNSIGDFDVTLTPTANNIILSIVGTNKEITDSTFTLSVSDSVDTISNNIVISSSESQGNAPTQINTIQDFTISGVDSQPITLENYFSNFDTVTLSFADEDTQSTQTITFDKVSLVGGEEFVNSLFKARIVSLLGNTNMVFEGKNQDYTFNANVQVSNDFGTSSQSFSVTINNDPNLDPEDIPSENEQEGVPSWIPNPPEEEKAFWALGIIVFFIIAVAFSKGENDTGSTLFFGSVGVISLFLIFTFLGWIPMWILLVLVLMMLFYIASIGRNMLMGNN